MTDVEQRTFLKVMQSTESCRFCSQIKKQGPKINPNKFNCVCVRVSYCKPQRQREHCKACVALSPKTQQDIKGAALSLVSGRRCYLMSSQGVNSVSRQEWRSKKLLQQWRSGVCICLHASLTVTCHRASHLILTDTSLNLPQCAFLQAKSRELVWVTLFYIISQR